MWDPRYHYNYCEAAQDAILDLGHGQGIGIHVSISSFSFLRLVAVSGHAELCHRRASLVGLRLGITL